MKFSNGSALTAGRRLAQLATRQRPTRLIGDGARLQNYRRLVTRWEYHVENYPGFVQLGRIVTLLPHS